MAGLLTEKGRSVYSACLRLPFLFSLIEDLIDWWKKSLWKCFHPFKIKNGVEIETEKWRCDGYYLWENYMNCIKQ